MDKRAIFKTAFVILVIALYSCLLVKMAIVGSNKQYRQPNNYQDSLAHASIRLIDKMDRLNGNLAIEIKKMQDSIISLNAQIDQIDAESTQIQNDNNEKVIYITRLSTDSLAMFITARYRHK